MITNRRQPVARDSFKRAIHQVFSGVFLFSLAVVMAPPVGAQTAGPQLLITWRANSYVPVGFQGKALPTTGSTLTASLAVLDGNKVVNLAGQKIYWYVNGEFERGGIGITHISFEVPGMAPNTVKVRAELPEYGDGSSLRTISIPIVRPRVVIGGSHSQSATATLTANPYFFESSNLSSLVYKWVVNGEEVQDGGKEISIPPSEDRSDTSVSLTIRNPAIFTDAGSATINLGKDP